MVVQSDILVCLLPLTSITKGIINKDLLNKLPTGSAIINFARGGIINTSDLLEALNAKHINHAVLDVFEQEPLNAESELWQHPDITILPHISAPTNVKSASDIVAKNITTYRATGQLPKTVNKLVGY
jgi:glyoxylate/hydroxypyruvate reductase A